MRERETKEKVMRGELIRGEKTRGRPREKESESNEKGMTLRD